MTLPTIPTSPRTLRDSTLEEEVVDPDAKLILSDFTQSIHPLLGTWTRANFLVTEYFPMDLYRSMFFINTLDHEYNRIYLFAL